MICGYIALNIEVICDYITLNFEVICGYIALNIVFHLQVCVKMNFVATTPTPSHLSCFFHFYYLLNYAHIM